MSETKKVAQDTRNIRGKEGEICLGRTISQYTDDEVRDEY